jgi:plastocyanin
MRRTRLAALALAAAASVTLAACGDGLPSPSPGTGGGPSSSSTATSCTSCGTVVSGVTPTVVVQANDQLKFVPQTVSISVGDVVEWRNVGTVLHSVTFQNDSAISDANLNGGQTFEVRFTQPGSFPYVCVYHQSLGMIGTVTVAGGAASGSAAASPSASAAASGPPSASVSPSASPTS